ncbi:hypothetical protein ES703_116639 [subsurface metagenome]
MRYITRPAFQQPKPAQNIFIGYATSAVGKHHIFTARLFYSSVNSVTFAVMALITDDLQCCTRKNFNIFRSFGGIVLAAVIDDYNLSRQTIIL